MIKDLFLLICLSFLWRDACSQTKKSQTMEPVNMGDWKLPSDEEYSLFYNITKFNFNFKVLKSRDAWIIILYKNKFNKLWRRQAQKLKSSVWFGLINYDQETELAQELIGKSSHDDLDFGVGFVYPYSRSKKSKSKFKQQWPWKVKNPEEAEKALEFAIPREFKTFTFKQENMQSFQDFIVNSYYESSPPRFPVLCIVDEPSSKVPVSTSVIANYFSKFFSFGIVWKKDLSKMLKIIKKVPQPKEFPHYFLLLGKEPTPAEMQKGKFGLTFDVFPFNHEKYGNSNKFLSIVKYLFTANEDYRETLLGREKSEPAYVQKMEAIRNALRHRLEVVTREYDLTLKQEL